MKLKSTILTAGIATGSILLLNSCKESGGGSDGDAGGGGEAVAGLVQVTPNFPEAEFQGTPVPLDDVPPNFEKPGKPKLVINLPEGCVNVAEGKPVTASAEPFIGDLELVTDNDAAGGDGFYIEIDPGLQWVQIDLEKVETIHGLVIWHYHKDARIYTDVVVQVSDNADMTGATTIYNNDFDNSAEMGEGKDATYVETNHGRIIEIPAGVKGQYVRLYSNGNSSSAMNNYVEVNVYAKGGETAEAAGE